MFRNRKPPRNTLLCSLGHLTQNATMLTIPVAHESMRPKQHLFTTEVALQPNPTPPCSRHVQCQVSPTAPPTALLPHLIINLTPSPEISGHSRRLIFRIWWPVGNNPSNTTVRKIPFSDFILTYILVVTTHYSYQVRHSQNLSSHR